MIKNKKAISEIVGYVLLIVIAISLSLLVYAWLKGMLYHPVKTCPDSISLYADYSCSNNHINLSIKNNGLFNLAGFIARISNTTEGKAIYSLSNNMEISFTDSSGKARELKPDEEFNIALDYSKYNQIKKLEIQPFISDNGVILCNNIIKQDLENCE